MRRRSLWYLAPAMAKRTWTLKPMDTDLAGRLHVIWTRPVARVLPWWGIGLFWVGIATIGAVGMIAWANSYAPVPYLTSLPLPVAIIGGILMLYAWNSRRDRQAMALTEHRLTFGKDSVDITDIRLRHRELEGPITRARRIAFREIGTWLSLIDDAGRVTPLIHVDQRRRVGWHWAHDKQDVARFCSAVRLHYGLDADASPPAAS